MRDMRAMGDGVSGRVAKRLAELQGDRSDAEMGRILGCSRNYYWQVKHSRRRISYEMAKRAGRVFPDVFAIVVQDLAAEVGG